jgi:sarcosine oxidase, subunit delta
MKQLMCPLNGLRDINEFAYGGPVKPMPASRASAADWAEYVFLEDNRQGRVLEWWLHIPSSFWFIAERDTASDEVIRTMTVGECDAV